MQAAVDIVNDSPHPTNKIAATIAGQHANGDWALSRTNHWPTAIENTIGHSTKIGNSSGTIHAETACILAANAAGHATKNASLFITDPPCPNCMKNMAEAGIAKLYIDHKGFDKDWAKRRGDSFEKMSMRIASKAGMDVFCIYRPKKDQEEKFEIISSHTPGYQPANEYPPRIEPYEDWNALIAKEQRERGDEPFALALATDENSAHLSVIVDRHPTIGYTMEDVEGKQGKYSFILQPINRLLMTAAREGLTLNPEYIYSSRTPTSRELTNFVGANLNTMYIGDRSVCRDQHGIAALETLLEHALITVKES